MFLRPVRPSLSIIAFCAAALFNASLLNGQQCTKPVGPTYYTNCTCGPKNIPAKAACYVSKPNAALPPGSSCGTECDSCYNVCQQKPLPPPALTMGSYSPPSVGKGKGQDVWKIPQPYNGAIEDGMLIEAGGNMVYLVENGKKRWVPTAPWIIAKGGWNSIRVISADKLDQLPKGDDLPLFPNGALIQVFDRVPDHRMVYLVEDGKKIWLPSIAWINEKGGQNSINIIPQAQLDLLLDGEPIPPFPDGVLIQVPDPVPDHAMVYLVEDGKRRWISSGATIDAHGGRNSIIMISQQQMDQVPKGLDLW